MAANLNYETLFYLSNLTKDFRASVKHAGGITQKKFDIVATPAEQQELATLAKAAKSATSAVCGTTTRPGEDALRIELRAAEINAGLVKRALTSKEIAKFVSAKTAGDEPAKLLTAAGCPKLASLYAPKH